MDKKRKIINYIALVMIGILILLFYRCPFQFFFGVSCPGCGMTRAFIALLHLDIVGAFRYHPLFPLAILVGIYVVLEYFKIVRLPEKWRKRYLWLVIGIFILTYIIRKYNGDEYLKYHIQDSVLGHVIEFVKNKVVLR